MTDKQSAGNRDALEAGEGGLFHLLESNKAWAAGRVGRDPTFFHRLESQQKPRYFWIGCSDSRVPSTQILDLDPGEVFVHRNVANLAVAGDPNFDSALQFAVESLHVEHILVVGHYGCGGIQATLEGRTGYPIGDWLAPVRSLHHAYARSGAADCDNPNTLCEHNVIAQVQALAANSIVQAAWQQLADLTLHGWVYGVADGLLRPVRKPVRNPFRPGADLLA